ncbi:hypothetical protein Pmar_PMAR028494 [Perkinsus marinus ATCC 50983]|uniref:Uncharacterized protein n=1 Tax=Perkinsus marinus (strain ATCC 50983 / TXsc) TaxID=423536 RepID=C5LMA3_PERM5|nr:hypothetical protein Pmar_PMAR028494 [Perkinsus marinus ATCC 50983]EER02115.1 hypothetical protein Pmar_PMAR028494 [Perkinsus marinus ATCC 50983]|eukprot:XP_002769397.1 hypothetical protein Pmar_PMAR028494 [Perkinsus marinus ATCC 50983]
MPWTPERPPNGDLKHFPQSKEHWRTPALVSYYRIDPQWRSSGVKYEHGPRVPYRGCRPQLASTVAAGRGTASFPILAEGDLSPPADWGVLLQPTWV